MMRLMVHKSKCTGCRLCETACVIAEDGIVSLLDSRIQIFHEEVEAQQFKVQVCRQCKLCPPLDVCPTEALTRDGDGVVHIETALCPDGCRLCVDACPLDAIYVRSDLKVTVCDLCGGDPMCIKYCETEALSLQVYEPRPSKLGRLVEEARREL